MICESRYIGEYPEVSCMAVFDGDARCNEVCLALEAEVAVDEVMSMVTEPNGNINRVKLAIVAGFALKTLNGISNSVNDGEIK